MRIAILLFPGFTVLDVTGPYEILSRLPGAEAVLVAERRGPVRDDRDMLTLVADAAFDEVTDPDVIVIPGGPEANLPLEPGPVHGWLRTADRHSRWTTSVCTGALILGAAGLLTGRRATGHWLSRPQLAGYGAEPADERVVTDGKYVTAAGVSAGIDMGLTLAGRLADDRTAQSIQLIVEYDPRPPYSAGSVHSAPAELVAEWKRVRGKE
ncbi:MULTISPECIES: DJ-1/PfpI family protein [Streptomyces]|uniref:DJ-1/PfpI family protein n=1 Tax=Streptomyces TaxID=1883 RepID=UPI00163D112E|nr:MULTISPECIES: DJ-1/PfpI family protein [Streptomyces]MBC2876854.1 DJ-1/PfpI family protein [Streptomyces sp. TYQ1024]UBI35883.1 DJ-1/PfpI family protein [Streptomyces mobaraensis]UKW28477.1 DJ-1/PfpI family protein [Streptomyces sp. TYQ1024]